MTEAYFLTQDERDQINNLMEKASERIRKINDKDSDKESWQFIFLHCQKEFIKHLEQKNQIREELEHDIELLLNQICTFCRKHCLPVCEKDGADEEDEEELPFPRWKKQY